MIFAGKCLSRREKEAHPIGKLFFHVISCTFYEPTFAIEADNVFQTVVRVNSLVVREHILIYSSSLVEGTSGSCPFQPPFCTAGQ